MSGLFHNNLSDGAVAHQYMVEALLQIVQLFLPLGENVYTS